MAQKNLSEPNGTPEPVLRKKLEDSVVFFSQKGIDQYTMNELKRLTYTSIIEQNRIKLKQAEEYYTDYKELCQKIKEKYGVSPGSLLNQAFSSFWSKRPSVIEAIDQLGSLTERYNTLKDTSAREGGRTIDFIRDPVEASIFKLVKGENEDGCDSLKAACINKLEYLRELQRKIEKNLIEAKFGKTTTNINHSWKKIIRNIKKGEFPDFALDAVEVAQMALDERQFLQAEIFNGYLKLKIERTRALRNIDERMGYAYLSFFNLNNPESCDEECDLNNDISQSVNKYLERFPEANREEIEMSIKKGLTIVGELGPIFHTLLKKDTEFYESLLNTFYIKEEEVKEPVIEDEPSVAPKQETLETRLLNAITANAKSEVFTNDMRQRTIYFVDDVTNKLDEAQLKELIESFSKYHFCRKFRNRDFAPDDITVRNFFDDITLKYVIKGEVPDEHELKTLYTNVLNECK